MSSIGPARGSVLKMRTTANRLGLPKLTVSKSMLIKACNDIIKYTTEFNARKYTEDEEIHTKIREMLQSYAENLQQIFSDIEHKHINAYNRNVYSAFQLLTLTKDHERLITTFITFITKKDFNVSIATHRAVLRRIAQLLLASIQSNTSLNTLVKANEQYMVSSAASKGGKRHSKKHKKQRRRHTRRQK